jgi:hypothetical protein
MMSRLTGGLSLAALAATLGLAGCGGEDDNTSQFVGTWRYASGLRTITCPNLGQRMDQLSGTLTLNKGVDAPLVVILSGCSLRLDISGSSATVRPGQICPPMPAGTLADGTAITETDTHQTGSFTVTGNTATIAESGSAQLVFGATEICNFTMNGTLTRETR